MFSPPWTDVHVSKLIERGTIECVQDRQTQKKIVTKEWLYHGVPLIGLFKDFLYKTFLCPGHYTLTS